MKVMSEGQSISFFSASRGLENAEDHFTLTG